MTRIYLAFACFFSILFAGRLPGRAAGYLPEGAGAEPEPEKGDGERPGALEEAEERAARAEKEAKEARAAAESARAKKPKADTAELHRDGALSMLGLLQREGRLVDFLLESLEDYEDADIGAAVRDIHRGCKKFLDDHLTIEPVMPGDEDDPVTVPRGFDPGEIRLIGEVEGDPPFKGTLVHHGWRTVDVKLPELSEGVDRRVLAPAEVNIS